VSDEHKLPEGWKITHYKQYEHSVIEAPQNEEHNSGGVSLYWKQRGFSLGYGGRPNKINAYSGRGWKEKMVTEACAALDSALIRWNRPAASLPQPKQEGETK
jgi:hypothetical protein